VSRCSARGSARSSSGVGDQHLGFVTRRGVWFLLVTAVALSCLRDSTAPRFLSGHLAVAPAFENSAAGIVDFDRVRITLEHPGGGTVLDTVIAIPATADSIDLSLAVPLTTASEDFLFYLRLINAAGDTVFRNAPYPQRVTVAAGGGKAPVEAPIVYVGVGFDAVAVAIGTPDTFVTSGQTLQMTAVALGADQQPIPGTPIAWRSLDSTRVRVPNRAVGQVVGGAVRGTARVVAELLTGPADTVLVAAQPVVAALSRISGDGQTAVPNAPLPLPLRVRVTATDGLGVRAPVAFRALTAGDTVSAVLVLSDSTGYAETIARLGSAAGARSFQASVSGVAAPVTFSASAASGSVTSVTLDRTIDTIPRGATLQYTATARDALGNPVSVTIGWTSTVPSVATVDTAGLARAVDADSTRIIASAAGHADTATLYVRALRSVILAPADTVVTAVGDSFDLRATAYDNFGAVLSTGFTRTFVSASPTVVTVNATTGRTRSVGAGNGVVVVRDSVDVSLKVQGTATVRVNQVTASIRNTPALPDSLQVGVSGRRAIVAAALDRNNNPIPNKTFGFRSADPAIASVDAAGIVTGVALGTTFVIDSVDGFKDSVKVAVVAAPPALLQWGFDSLAVGNGGSVSVPLTLSRTDPAPVSVLLSVLPASDTMIARPASGCPGGTLRRVQVPAGASATSVLVCGLAAGRVTFVAQDSAGSFLPDTMVVTVVSTIEFREIGTFSQQSYFYVNQNETHRAQVFLSDPAPAGGLGVTFVYGQGKSAISPAPAIIPAGQLAADVVIQGLVPGIDSVTPTSGGFVGKFSRVYVASNNLSLQRPYPYTGMLGVGQTFQPYVGITYAMDHPLVVVANLSSGIGTVQTPDTIRPASTSQYFTVAANAAGKTVLSVTAAGWVGASDTLTFTTPRLVVSGSTSLIAGDPTLGSWNAYASDSLGYQHAVQDTLVVTVVSRNPSAVVVDLPTAKLLPGSSVVSRANALRALSTAGGDTAWIVLSAPGYATDSFRVLVTKPTLTLQLGYPYTGRVGLSTIYQNAGYVQIPYVRSDTFTVTFAHSRAGTVRGPASVRIPANQTTAYFTLIGDTLGVDTLSIDTVATPGYVVAGGAIVYQVDSLHVRPLNYPGTTNYTIGAPYPVTAYAYDPFDGQARPLIAPLRVNLASSNPATFTLDSAAVTIDSGQYYSFNHPDTLRFVAVDTVGARILSSAPGSTPDSSNLIKVFPTPLAIQLGYPYAVGRGLRSKNNYVYVIGGNVPDTVKVALRRFDPTLDTLPSDTVRILKGQNASQQFEIWALDSSRTDSIVASAPGYVSARLTITPEPVSLIQTGLPATRFTTDPAYGPYVYTGTRSRTPLNPVVPVSVTVVSTDPTVMQIDSASSVNATGDTAVTIVDTSQAYAYVRVVFVGSGSARLRYSAAGFLSDSTPLVTVTGPALNLSTGANQTLGVGQLFAPTASQYVYVNNPVTGSPLVVQLLKSDSTLPAASQAFTVSPASVTIPVGETTSGAFEVQGNSIGAAVLTARATGYSQATTNLSIGQPTLVLGPQTMTLSVGQVPQPVTVYAEDQSGSTRYVASALTVGDTSANAGVAAGDSLVVQIPARQYYTSVGVRGFVKGATQIVFSAAGYVSDTLIVQVDTARLQLNSPPDGLGAGQVAPSQMYVSLPYYTNDSMTVSLASGDPAVLTVPSQVTIAKASNYAYFAVTGTGIGTANVTATAANVKPAVPVPVRISTPKFQVSLNSATIAGQKTTVTVYSQDSLGTMRNPAAPLTLALASSVPARAAFDSATIHIPATTYYASTGVVFDTAGSYIVTASAPGYAAGSATTVTTGALVTIADFSFTPQTVTITRNQYVTWKNTGAVTHTATDDASAWNSGGVAPGAVTSVFFSTPGSFSYHCAIHPGMTGTVVVNP
jgi:plastocyanin